MTVAIVLESETLVGPDLRWPLRIAAAAGDTISIIVATREEGTTPRRIDLAATDDGDTLARRVRETLDENLGADRWAVNDPKAAASHASASPRIGLHVVPERDVVESALSRLKKPGTDMLQIVASAKSFFADQTWGRFGREFERRCACRIVYVGPGTRSHDGDLVTSVSVDRNARAATRLAAQLAEREDRQLVAVYAEPDIGPDSQRVGRRVLDRLLRNTLPEGASARQRVEVTDDPATGIVRAAEPPGVEVVFVGMTRVGTPGHGRERTASGVARTIEGPTLVGVRNPVPLKGRLGRFLLTRLQRLVPQLERDDRTGLVERIQSTSYWNFDFVLLMALSTTIAALGLLDNSAAVIIGAMLIAPLMTPLLGIGLAIAQGNPRLARVTLKAASLGFLTAFAIAIVVGFLSPEFHRSTSEMAARDWPQLLDLLIAAFGGFAAAYASGRPGLLAALPGVAIAAALVPPIATAGLGVSIGSYELAIGAALLFLANVVAIVFASALTFWAVGIRIGASQTVTTRVVTAIFVVAAIGMAVGFTLAPPRLEPSRALYQAIASSLDEDTRLRRMRLKKESGDWVVQVDLGGANPPDDAMRVMMLQHAKAHLGADAGVRVTYRYEVVER